MQTMMLLDAALKKQPATQWTKELKLSRGALATAKTREHLSPAIAYVLAEELGENPEMWALIAAAESERDSACKDRMLRRLKRLKVPTFMSEKTTQNRQCAGFFWRAISHPTHNLRRKTIRPSN